ncbi:hypothetical protein DAMA08_034500 [Martiniozyma asiatica (nom. inval.)]|nr:hypothetical protein DAMA08_034500 [Martiniozyma asiatica]
MTDSKVKETETETETGTGTGTISKIKRRASLASFSNESLRRVVSRASTLISHPGELKHNKNSMSLSEEKQFSIPLISSGDTIETLISIETLVEKSEFLIASPEITIALNSDNDTAPQRESAKATPLYPLITTSKEMSSKQIEKTTPVSENIPAKDPVDKNSQSFTGKIYSNIKKIYAIIADTTSVYLSAAKKTTESSFANVAKFFQHYYFATIRTIKSYPLVAYDALYLISSALAASGLYLYHKNYLRGQSCTSCVHSNNALHITGGAAICLGIMGIGNYVYLKKSKK